MDYKIYHEPVLLNHLLQHFMLNSSSIIVDGTMGFGGHAHAILKEWPSISYLGFDKDVEAIKLARQRCHEFQSVDIIHAPFSSMHHIINERQITPTHFLLDLGVSSFQIDRSGRGFTFQQDEMLDMRMNLDQEKTAQQILNEFSKDALIRLFQYGADLQSPSRLVEEIMAYRSTKPFKTTFDLVQCVKRGIFVKSRAQFIAMCTKVFQAVRIEVNNEMEELTSTLRGMLNYTGALVGIISFQPNEDRFIKQFVKENNLKKINKKPFQSSYNECKKNPREKSAKLRIFQV